MKFGLLFTNIGPFAGPEGALAIATGAEAAGFESLWAVEHVLVPAGYESTYPYDPSGRMPAPDDFDITDPIVWLTYVAGATSTIKLGTGILILPQRHPAITAKAAATVDRLSGGRFILGVGAGWLEEEFDALGASFADRGARLDEYIEAMRSLWADGPSTFDGTYSKWTEVHCNPKPAGGKVPIVIGGHSKVAARRAGRLGDGFFPGEASPESIQDLLDAMNQAAEEAGRDPAEIEVTMPGTVAFGPNPIDDLKALEDAGISRVIIPPLSFDPAGIGSALDQFGENVIAKVR